MTATTQPLTPNTRVCRRSCRCKIVGTVISVGRTHARVKWERYLGGLTRLGSGVGQSSSVRLSDLVREEDFVPRPLSGPDESLYRPYFANVELDDGSRVIRDGINFWHYAAADEEKAIAHGRELAASGQKVVVRRQEKADWVPEGCRAARVKYRWIELFRS